MKSDNLYQEAQHSFIEGDFNKCIDLFSEAETKGCNPVNTHLSKGAAYLRLQEYDKAVEDLEMVLEIDPDNERAYYFRGIAYMNKGDFEKAKKDLTSSIKRNHKRGAAYFARGLAHGELDYEEEAVRDFKTAIAFSDVEVDTFLADYGSHRTMFEKSMAMIEGERGPLGIVLDETEVEKLKKFME